MVFEMSILVSLISFDRKYKTLTFADNFTYTFFVEEN